MWAVHPNGAQQMPERDICPGESQTGDLPGPTTYGVVRTSHMWAVHPNGAQQMS